MSQSGAGKSKIAIDATTLADGDSIASYVVDASGTLVTGVDIGGNRNLRVVTPSHFAEDSAHTSGDYGSFALAVRHDADTSMVSADGDYAPLQVDANGKLKVAADLDVDFDYVYNEDAAHTSGDLGAYVLAVRQDTLANSTSADGDYASFKLNTLGELYVHDTDVKAELVAANTSLDAIEADVDSLNSLITALSKAEDAVHSSGDQGIMSLGIRNDNQSTTLTSASGDYSGIATDKKGAVYTKDIANGSNLQQVVTVGTTALALPASPLADRSSMMIQMLSGGQLYLGSATVTNSGATRGFKLGEGGFVSMDAGPSNVIYGIANAAGKEVVVWEFA